jgi:hypothetical protein
MNNLRGGAEARIIFLVGYCEDNSENNPGQASHRRHR